MRFATRTTIAAAPEQVWAILTDLPQWPTWNTTVISTDGHVALGSKVSVTVKANPGRAFAVKVKTLDAPSRMTWVGGMPLGLFAGTRTYTLTPQDGGTEFAMEEVYTGPMAGLITKSIPDLQPSFDEFAACLKKRVEAPAQESA
jgi:uncharacterized protein YndB with AHSA1/START domain